MLDHVEIKGFRRLLDTAAYVGRKTVALVGPNEAGKSSVLAALRLFEDESAVDPQSFSRTDRPRVRDSAEDVVVVSIALTRAQQELLDTMPLGVAPTHYRWHKRVSGGRRYSFNPSPTLSDAFRKSAAKAWDTLSAALTQLADDPSEAELSEYMADFGTISAQVSGGEIDDAAIERVQERIAALKETTISANVRKALVVFEEYLKLEGGKRALASAIRARLGFSIPLFAMFGELERTMDAEYDIDADRTEQSIALANLLQVAELPLDVIRNNASDSAYLQQLLDEANVRLDAFFESKWSQEQVAVGLFVDGGVLRVFVKDKREGSVGWLNITERSDGLRMFVALATFLARRNPDVPPILLIDEADQHLHLNAQADFVRMLQDLKEVQQVIYTTHSPGCLPADLGNGVRFVEPLEGGTSIIRHDFWSMQNEGHVGFNPLLMVMGAGAAAFSGLREALIVEGASDMLILPTLIRLATDLSELPYQIAPGIATASQADMTRLDLVASRVAFLVDGDKSGLDWLEQLEIAGVPKSRMKVIGENAALEDFLDSKYYLETLNDFFRLPPRSLPTLTGAQPVKTEVAAWAKANRIAMPGPVVVAEQMLGMHESGERRIVINARRRRNLQAVHNWALKTLGEGPTAGD